MALDKLTKLTSQSGIKTTLDYSMSDLTVDTITIRSGGGIGGGRINTGLVTVTTLTPGTVVHVGTGQTLTESDNLTWDNTNVRLKNLGITSTRSLNVTGVSTFAANVSIADKIIHTGDTDTALRFPTADTITAEVGGSEITRITSSGLGINVTPNRELHVKGLDAIVRVESTSATGRNVIEFFDSSAAKGSIGWPASGNDHMAIQQSENADMWFSTNDTERLRILSDGDVWINPSSTSMQTGASLSIVSDKNVETGVDDMDNYHLVLKNPNNDTGEAIGLAFGITDTAAKVGAAILHERDAAGSQGSLKFLTRPSNAGPPAERLRIDSGGRILIGHYTSQSVYSTSALQVQGTDAATSSLSLLRQNGSPYLSLGATGGSSLGGVVAVSADDRLGQLTFAGADGTDVNTHACSVSGYCDGSVSGNTVPGRLVFTTSTGPGELERLRITSGGKIGFNYAAAPPSEDIMICSHGQNPQVGVTLSHLSGGNRYGARFQSLSGANQGISISRLFNSTYTEALLIDTNGVLTTKQSHTNATTSNWNGAVLGIQNTHDTDSNASVLWFQNSAGATDCAIQGIHEDAAGSGSSRRGHIQFGVSGALSSGACTERMRLTGEGHLTLGSGGHNLSQVGGEEITGQDYDAILKIYNQTNNRWLIQGRSDTSTGPNGIFIRSGNTSSNYSLYVCGIDEVKRHLVVNGKGAVGIGTDENEQKENPSLHIHNPNANDDCRIVFSTPNKSNCRIGYYGLSNRFGMDVCNGFQIRDSTASFATRITIDSSGNMSGGLNPDGSMWDAGNNNGWYYNWNGASFQIATRANTGYSCMYINKNTGGGGGQDNRYIDWYWDSTKVGGIHYDSGGTDYDETSDYRLKENVVAITDGIAKVKQLKPNRYNFIGHGGKTREGFLAHEAQEVIPHACSGTKDAMRTDERGDTVPDYQGIDYGKFTPILTAALQEAIAKIETLETKVAALESG